MGDWASAGGGSVVSVFAFNDRLCKILLPSLATVLMTPLQKLRLRMEEACSIYQDSPQITLTYIDAKRLVDDMMEILDIIEHEHNKKIGFAGGI